MNERSTEISNGHQNQIMATTFNPVRTIQTGIRWLNQKLHRAAKLEYVEKIEELYDKKIGVPTVEKSEHFTLLKFQNDEGFDYETYKQIQIITNKAKLGRVFVKEGNIADICKTLEEKDISVQSVLCHGTRNGAEQLFFKKYLKNPGAIVVGTEISDNAKDFPMTIEWDFHQVKPEWLGAIDLVYSNSWDHSYDPDQLFHAWLSCVRPGGAMVLEWSPDGHGSKRSSVSDPFCADLEGLLEILARQQKEFPFHVEVAPQTCEPHSGWKNIFVYRQ